MKFDYYAAGFDWAVHGIEPTFPPRNGSQERDFDRGIAVGKDALKEAGGIPGLRKILADTDRIRKKALDSHALLVKAIKRLGLPKAEREKRLFAIRLEPCVACKNIALCAVTQRTCGRFRSYVARGGHSDSTVPDKHWSKAFPINAEDL